MRTIVIVLVVLVVAGGIVGTKAIAVGAAIKDWRDAQRRRSK